MRDESNRPGDNEMEGAKRTSILKEKSYDWLRLLRDSDLLTNGQADSLLTDCDELQRMLVSAIKTSKAKLS
jgi:hypothetical protein